MNTDSVGFLGYGEVGQALASFYKNPKIKDLQRDDNLHGIDLLHVCFPYSSHFVDEVTTEIKDLQPRLTIIHSTVAPYTTRTVAARTAHLDAMVVHSPVRGTHPHLRKGLETFVKYIGADDLEAGTMAEDHFKSLGIRTRLFRPAATTEIGKLFDTTYYALCIAWHGEMKKICDEFGVDFDEAVTAFNMTYNEGYSQLGMPHVVRPVLSPPEGYIRGHCVIPNAKILASHFKSLALDFVLSYAPENQHQRKLKF